MERTFDRCCRHLRHTPCEDLRGVLDGEDKALSQPRDLATTKMVRYEDSRIYQNSREKKRRD
jgi:hypothetical protein